MPQFFYLKINYGLGVISFWGLLEKILIIGWRGAGAAGGALAEAFY